jgi:hypothetical protein
MAGFCELATGLPAPIFGILSTKLPIVSGGPFAGQSGMAVGEIMAHFLITSLEPLVIKAVREILLAAKERADRGN